MKKLLILLNALLLLASAYFLFTNENPLISIALLLSSLLNMIYLGMVSKKETSSD